MTSPKKKTKPKRMAKKNAKRETDSQVLRKLFPPEVVDYVETRLKASDGTEKE